MRASVAAAVRTSIVVATVAFSGCHTVNAELPGTLRGDVEPARTEKVGALKIEKTHYFYLWGLVGAPPADFIDGEIRRQVEHRDADGVANLTYEAKTGCLDLVIGCATCCIVSPRSYVVTGDIVRIHAAPIEGAPVAREVPRTKRLRADAIAPSRVLDSVATQQPNAPATPY